MRRLTLVVTEFTSPQQWKWSLHEGDRELGRHEVLIADGEWRFAAFADLFGHIGWRTTAAGRHRVEPAAARELGEWAALQLLGDVIVHLDRPATVEVLLPGPAVALGLLPLEAVVVDGRTLALRHVTFAWHTCSDGPHSPPARKRHPGDPLRILAVFSLPTGATALALRRERVALTRLIDRAGGDIELRVLQYGTTRETVRAACGDSRGWDLVHISGHGEATGIMLEKLDSTVDPVSAEELVRLMLPLRDRISVLTLSACESAAVSGDASLARSVADRLDCAVMAMRFPVGDDFAAELMLGVYDEMLNGRHELPAALGRTLDAASRKPGRQSALSFSTPTLFGCRAASAATYTNRARPPSDRPGLVVPAPDRFVGRVGILARARRSLAVDAAVLGVVFHGMTGAGKTACARELVDITADEFDSVVWHPAPPDDDPAVALVGFAEALDARWPELELRASIGGAGFSAALSRVAEQCRRHRVLTVIDDAETLLDSDGRWVAPQWMELVSALTPAGANSRLVITSRTPVAGDYHMCILEPLSRDESLLLIMELPRLRELLRQRLPEPTRLITRVLELAQGHPAILELAEAQTEPGRPDSLRTVLDSIETGGSHYPGVLIDWTEQALRSLALHQQRLFRFLCCLEEPDRHDLLAGSGPMNWHIPWSGTGGEGEIEHLLPPLLAAGLVVPNRNATALHPAVVSHTREQDPQYAAEVCEGVASGWGALFVRGLWAHDSGGLLELVAWRGLPYAARLRDAFRLQTFADYILREDHSRATTIVLSSLLAPSSTWSMGSQSRRILDYLLAKIQRDTAADSVETMRSVVEGAAAAGDHFLVRSMSAELFERLFRLGDIAEAEAVAQSMIEAVDQDGTLQGRLDMVIAERFRIDVLNRRGRHREAMTAGAALLDRIEELGHSDFAGLPEAPFYLSGQRQRLLQALASAAGGVHRWDLALDYDRAQLDELRRRDASAQELAEVVYNIYIPLMKLGRLDEAAAAVDSARAQFEQTGTAADLGRGLGASGEIEIRRGNLTLGIDLVAEGLRCSYRMPDAENVAIMHAVYGDAVLRRGELDLAVAHLAVSAAILLRLGSTRAEGSLLSLDHALSLGGRFAGDAAATAALGPPLSAGFGALARKIELSPDALAQAIRTARGASGELPVQLRAIWDPLLSALAAVGRGETAAFAPLVRALAEQQTNPDWDNVVTAIKAMLLGNDQPHDGDVVDRLLLNRARAAWAGEPVIRPHLWGALPIRELLGTVAIGLLGDEGARDQADRSLQEPRLDGVPLVVAMRGLLAGDRDRNRLVHGLDLVGSDVIETMLDYVS